MNRNAPRLFHPHLPHIGRRGLLLGFSALMAAGQARLAVAGTSLPGSLPGTGEARLVIVLLRGALDGLASVPAYGDPDFAALRGGLALPEPGQEGGLLDLGGFFGLHPALSRLHGFYLAGEALILQAAAGPYRTRSHFDAQDMLESGGPERLASGWLNRALAGLDEAASAEASRRAVAVGADMPLLLRGPSQVGMYQAAGGGRPHPDLYARLAELAHDDPVLGPAVAEGLRGRRYAESRLGEERRRNGFSELAAAAGTLLAAPDGPRVAALELGGWDTHAEQNARLRGPLGHLDAGLGALRDSLGEAWRHTAVLVMTEFGRTVRVNGNAGTDHGTGGAAFLLGGAVAGGRVMADWPGLGAGRLFENRDLQPTLDLRRVAKGLLRDHLRLPGTALEAAFPGSADAAPLAGLLRG